MVVEPLGSPAAVLIRALEPLTGIDAMFERRGQAARSPHALCSGPAKLCRALGIDGDLNGHRLDSEPLRLLDDRTPPPTSPRITARIGLSRGADRPWRWCVPDNTHVSP